jgi:hypothetical protein
MRDWITPKVREKVCRFPRLAVVMLEWPDPIFAMGSRGPELVEIANGELPPGKKGEYSAAVPSEHRLPDCRDRRRNPPRRFFRRTNRSGKLATRRIAGRASPRLMVTREPERSCRIAAQL